MRRASSTYRAVPILARWLAWTVVGWFVYALGRALYTVVYLGVPWYDWQWYAAIVTALIVLLVRLAGRWPRGRAGRVVLFVLLLWILIGFAGFWRAVQLYPARSPSVPISFWAPFGTSQAPETVLADIRAAGGWIYLGVCTNQLGEGVAALIEGLQRLVEHDVAVYLAVCASDFVSVPVHEEWMANVREAAQAVQSAGLNNVRGIIGDAEYPKYTPLDLWGRDREGFFQAAGRLDDLVSWMRKEHPGLPLGVTATWPLYVDSFDGDADLSIVQRCPVNPPGTWDFVNVMNYSSYFPPSWRAYYVYLVERTMVRLYPGREPSYLVGLAVPGASQEPVLDYDDLVRDARVSRALGASEIVVFKLTDRTLERFGDDFIRRFSAAVNDTPSDLAVRVPFSRPASLLLYGVVVVDALLDVWSWRGLLLLGWAVLGGLVAWYRVVRYDLGRVRAAFGESGLLQEGGALARCFLLSIETGRNVAEDFLAYARGLAQRAGQAGSPVIPDEIWEQAATTYGWDIAAAGRLQYLGR